MDPLRSIVCDGFLGLGRPSVQYWELGLQFETLSVNVPYYSIKGYSTVKVNNEVILSVETWVCSRAPSSLRSALTKVTRVPCGDLWKVDRV